MNHYVPDFEMDEDYSIPTSSSSLTRQKKSAMGEEEIMELLWQNGQVVVQSQNQRSFNKSPVGSSDGEAEIPAQQLATVREIRSIEHETVSQQQHQQQLFMHEDELASWLHYPLEDSSFDRDIYSDLLYPPAPSAPITTATPPREIRPLTPSPPLASVSSPRPPIPPPSKRTDLEDAPKLQNFSHFSRMPRTRIEPGPSSSSKEAKDLTVVDSNETPIVGTESRVSQAADSTAQCGTISSTAPVGTSTTARNLATTCELTVSSSPGCSSIGASAESPSSQKPNTTTPEDRKRKGKEADDAEYHSEDIEFESADAKKQARRSTSTKRSRAAEVHNLSERRRRDRINEKMRALQELIPRCNKSDKASMLDDAIEYLKSLQLQVQMISMGCGMLPMMYPGFQQFMPAIGMGMGIGMGMNRPMMPYPHLIPGSGMPNPAATANMGQRFRVPAFHMQPVPVPDPSRIQSSSQPDPMLNLLIAHDPNQPRMPNFADPYQQFIGLHQAQMSIPQSQVVVQPMTNKPSSSREGGNPETHQSGRLISDLMFNLSKFAGLTAGVSMTKAFSN